MYEEQIVLQEDRVTKWSLSQHELPIDDALRLIERGKIHLRMHIGKLRDGILEPLVVSIDSIIGELLLRLLEELNLFGQLPFNLPQQDLALGDPLLQLGHFRLHLLDLLLQIGEGLPARCT